MSFPEPTKKLREEISKVLFERVRHPMRVFAYNCEQVLKDNDHKGGWKKCSKRFMISKLLEETNELVNEILNNGNNIRKESCDVANIAMMIRDNWG